VSRLTPSPIYFRKPWPPVSGKWCSIAACRRLFFFRACKWWLSDAYQLGTFQARTANRLAVCSPLARQWAKISTCGVALSSGGHSSTWRVHRRHIATPATVCKLLAAGACAATSRPRRAFSSPRGTAAAVHASMGSQAIPEATLADIVTRSMGISTRPANACRRVRAL